MNDPTDIFGPGDWDDFFNYYEHELWERMKTSTNEVLCDGCGEVIPPMHPTAIFATLRGPRWAHKKLDLCDKECFREWLGK